ncbi:MAG: tRNA-dihydrouridine synthase [Patescibacteria group bacterium]|nr:tRNA-dihydrouridine synthase [Patescibacteria group bacterium]
MLKPIIALAPMADYTDQPFSLLCREVAGKNFIIYREMVSSQAITRGNAKTFGMCETVRREHPVIMQIFGDQPVVMAQAARIIAEKFQPDGIDINMGCPVPKIAHKTRAGAALMKYPDLAVEIIEAIKAEKLGLPLSVKTRLGWSADNEIFDFAPRLAKAGIDLLTIHGRTKAQGYAGAVDWKNIGVVKKLLKIPVLANGDIRTPADIKRCLAVTGADGVMIGRGALGNPWIFKTVRSSQFSVLSSQFTVSKQELIRTVLRHAELHLAHYGERGMTTFRKHLAWYFHGERVAGWSDVKKIRAELVRVSTMPDLQKILERLE